MAVSSGGTGRRRRTPGGPETIRDYNRRRTAGGLGSAGELAAVRYNYGGGLLWRRSLAVLARSGGYGDYSGGYSGQFAGGRPGTAGGLWRSLATGIGIDRRRFVLAVSGVLATTRRVAGGGLYGLLRTGGPNRQRLIPSRY
jgi:hypothetical protein